MNCVIIEDEPHVANHLVYLLNEYELDCKVLCILPSVVDSVLWLKNNQVDLIFMDIQLSDGISFEIFDQVDISIPVIFITSYNTYALDAFKRMGIAYLLKPLDVEELKAAIAKYRKWFGNMNTNAGLAALSSSYQTRFMVQVGNHIRSVEAAEIAFIYVKYKQVFIACKDGTTWPFDNTMEYIEKRLNAQFFFRINRQFIVNRSGIEKMFNETRGRVKILTKPESKEDLIVSIDRASEFKKWLNQ